MPLFSYTAIRSGQKSRVKGRIPATDEKHARALLREPGLQPIAVQALAEEKPRPPALSLLVTFSRQLGTLLKAGFPMDRALAVLAASAADERMKAILMRVAEGVHKGERISVAVSEAMAGGRQAGFGPVQELVAMIEAGEASGDLSNVLLQYAELLERRQAFRRRLRGALFYPLVVTCLALCVIVFLFVYVLPTITKLFTGTRIPLPLPTRILFSIVEIGKIGFWPILVALGGGGFVLERSWASERFRLKVENATRSLPLLGLILERAAIARWARSFGSLLKNNVEILYAMDLSGRAAHSLRLKEALQHARPEVAEGVPLSKALAATGIFPPLAVEAVHVGEQSGALPELLTEMAEAWETEVETQAERFADLLEPLVLVVMGTVIGGIVLAVLLPIFELNSSIK